MQSADINNTAMAKYSSLVVDVNDERQLLVFISTIFSSVSVR